MSRGIETLDGLRLAVEAWEAELAKYYALGSPANVAALFIDEWQYPYTDADVIACALAVAEDMREPATPTRRPAWLPAAMSREQALERWRSLLAAPMSQADATLTLLDDFGVSPTHADSAERTLRNWSKK